MTVRLIEPRVQRQIAVPVRALIVEEFATSRRRWTGAAQQHEPCAADVIHELRHQYARLCGCSRASAASCRKSVPHGRRAGSECPGRNRAERDDEVAHLRFGSSDRERLGAELLGNM